MHSHFLIGGFTASPALRQPLQQALDPRSYDVYIGDTVEAFLQWIWQNRHRVDCLVLECAPDLAEVLETLKKRDILLPVLLVETDGPKETGSPPVDDCHSLVEQYHEGTICLLPTQLPQLEHWIREAINYFLKLPRCDTADAFAVPPSEDSRHFVLSLQQQRLAEKLRERLGYMGVFYKRDPSNFARNLDPKERAELFEQLRQEYRILVLSYFNEAAEINSKIDTLVNSAFFADISVSKIVEIHMELMETFAKQLKLEGRNEEILLDYRLTLIDVIAHLCEMYRRSIPREAD